ncbi:MAG: hypothetical protein WD851_03260 [Pirellulales bacterium]
MIRPSRRWPGLILIGLSLITYAISFFLPVFKDVDGIYFGYEAFYLSSSFAVNDLVSNNGGIPPVMVWFANVFWFVGVIFFFRSIVLSLVFGCVSVVLASLYMFQPDLLLGYYVWVASMYLLLLAALIRARKGDSRQN